MQVASEILLSISQDEKERAINRSRRMFQTDMQSNLATAEDRGEARGEARGITIGEKKKTLEIAKNILQMGLSVDEVVKMTGLMRTEVESL